MRVLLVEDDANLLDLSARLLERRGHSICRARNVIQAFLCLVDHEIDVAIIDLVLVGERGEELADTIRMQWPDVRLIAVTGSAAQPVGFDRVVFKPYHPHDLASALEDA